MSFLSYVSKLTVTDTSFSMINFTSSFQWIIHKKMGVYSENHWDGYG